MGPLITPGFHHVTLVSRDARRSARFYRDVLGLAMAGPGTAADETEGQHLCFGDARGQPGTLVTVLEWPQAGQGTAGIGGVHHTAFGVATDEALLKWKRYLGDQGVPVSGPYDRGYFTSLYFRDPDGQVLEIATAGPGYAIDEPADALGRELRLPPERIVVGHRDEAAIAALTHAEPVPSITPDMALGGIHHVSGITDDLERAGDFYEAALGLRLVKKTTNRDAPDTLHYFWARYDGQAVAPGSSWTLFGWPPSWKQARAGTGQTHHVGFRVGDDDALGAWVDHLRAMDVQTSEVVDRGFFRGVYFRAPDGLLLQLATDGPGVAGAGQGSADS